MYGCMGGHGNNVAVHSVGPVSVNNFAIYLFYFQYLLFTFEFSFLPETKTKCLKSNNLPYPQLSILHF